MNITSCRPNLKQNNKYSFQFSRDSMARSTAYVLRSIFFICAHAVLASHICRIDKIDSQKRHFWCCIHGFSVKKSEFVKYLANQKTSRKTVFTIELARVESSCLQMFKNYRFVLQFFTVLVQSPTKIGLFCPRSPDILATTRATTQPFFAINIADPKPVSCKVSINGPHSFRG